MLSLNALPADRQDDVLALCRYAGIRSRAFDYFKSSLNYEMAERVAATAVESADLPVTLGMLAELNADHAAASDAAALSYRATGQTRDLVRAGLAAEKSGGWRAAVPWLLRAIAIAPLDPTGLRELYRILVEANQLDDVGRLAGVMNRAAMHPYINGVFLAAAKLGQGDAAGAAKDIMALKPPAEGTAVLRDVRGYALKVAGEALDKAGDYQGSYRTYVEMNRLDVTAAIDPKRAIDAARQFAGMQIPALPAAGRKDVVMMLGFARTGTTLLEIALGNHPAIEAFEEPTTLDIAMAYAQRARRSGQSAGASGDEFFTGVRDVYYRELQRIQKKPAAQFLVDKYPMRSIHAKFLDKLIPDQRYIFCVRHPYDVVLSCFRQRFVANPAMESFTSWPAGIALYDFVMTQWFETHSLDDARVHYVRYDDVVADFDATVAATLDFVGAGWDDSVRDFAGAAENAAALTPSYHKVRRGLSLGIQSYWRNYRFLFDAPEAKPLKKWAEYLRYPT
jgi:tetratricopeptide (TPR) repeat protein